MSGIDVRVEPATFTLVEFDAGRIAELVAEAGGWVGLGEGDTVVVKVDESSPLGQTAVIDGDPIVLQIEGGAIEDQKRIRKLSDVAVQTVAVRLLCRVADRRRPGFGGPPEEDVTVAAGDIWDVWALGRASRGGLEVNQQRWRYRFRNRHGFTDVADRVFDRFWAAGDDVVWADVVAACEETAGAAPVTSGRGR